MPLWTDALTPAQVRNLDRATQTALRWHERAREMDIPEDRYLALWLTLEILSGGPGTDMLKRVWDLIVHAMGGPDRAAAVRERFDVRALRDLRNRIVAGTVRELAPTNVAFTVSEETLRLMDALVSDTLRSRAGLAPRHALASLLGIAPSS
ncbi:MAG: hypothetical protein HY678_01885 [Chloroflexi bacterium]|nr:hypothetical protein [Chloroflexota bacterium]